MCVSVCVCVLPRFFWRVRAQRGFVVVVGVCVCVVTRERFKVVSRTYERYICMYAGP